MFIGRSYEIKILTDAVNSTRAELVILYGRRRVGKSSLLKHLIQSKIGQPHRSLYFEGIQGVSLKKQIFHFTNELAKMTKSIPYRADSWPQALDAFTGIVSKGKHYIVFDEFQWMASERKELISLIKYYWDRHWKENPGVKLILCGSVAQFMVKHLVHSTALHNRKTLEIKLDSLPAHEAKLFFRGKRSYFEIAKFLMIFGGIPKYLEQLDPSRSLSENMDRLCFQKYGFFVTEFETLFKEQFKVIKTYESIVRFLSKESQSKESLAKALNVEGGGGLTGYLTNLEAADFVKKFPSLSLEKSKGTKTQKYVLWDEWLHFYFSYIEPNLLSIQSNTSRGLFESLTNQSLAAYFGLAFERLCFKNLPNLLEHLNILPQDVLGYGPFFRQGPRTSHRSKKKGQIRKSKKIAQSLEGVQIDALIHRKGQILSLIECKFSINPIGTEVIAQVQRKIELLQAPQKYTVERVLIAANGVTPELQRSDYFHRILGLEAIFELNSQLD